jgi:hypothetical protein
VSEETREHHAYLQGAGHLLAPVGEGDARPDQISVGPIWATPTKEGRPATGLARLAGLIEDEGGVWEVTWRRVE